MLWGLPQYAGGTGRQWTEDYSGESMQGSDYEGDHPTEEKLHSDKGREYEIFPNPELWGLGFKYAEIGPAFGKET